MTNEPNETGADASAATRDLTLSFVIPAFREEAHVGQAIRSIFEVVPPKLIADVVVVDHGSPDRTVEVAESAGARVYVFRDGTIGAQRNRGAARTTGDVLVFLDADVTLTPAWGVALRGALERLRSDARVLTGAHTVPPEPGTFIERHWFSQLARESDSRHLGSAHLIITRAHFDAIGGFDEVIETGEDFELCVRAARHGSTIVNDVALRVVHHDFPKSARAFVRRERWHGRGGVASWAMVRNSKVVALTAVFAALHAAVPLAAVIRPSLAVVPIGGVAALCALASVAKFRGAPPTTLLANSAIFYLYFSGRSLALFDAITGKTA